MIWRADKRDCTGCNMAEWDGKAMPRFSRPGKQVLDPRTAFQVVHMLTGVVQRGTAVVLRDLNFPLFGKTGTTSGPTNVWFVGGSPDIVAGVYIGYDQPRNLGGYAQGGTLRGADLQAVRQGKPRSLERAAIPGPAGHPDGPDRPASPGRRVFGGLADRRTQGERDLGSIQARYRATPRRAAG